MSKYTRILLKLSGESISGSSKTGIDFQKVTSYVKQIKEITAMGIEIGIVIGGGNIFRGLSNAEKGFDRVSGDKMGMLATVINSLALVTEFQRNDINAKLLTATPMPAFGELFLKEKAIQYLSNKTIVMFAGGTGNPYFTTDTAAALRAIEIEADVFIKGTRVDGVFDANPEKVPGAKKFSSLKFEELYAKKLRIMDLTAATLCQENNMPIIVFNMDIVGNLKRLLTGKNIGTLVE